MPMLAAFAVLLCALAKSIFRGMRAFGSATLGALVACATLASLFDADGYIAKTNLDRAARGKHLDTAYLASLSADACVVADHPVLTKRPELRRFVAHFAQYSAVYRLALGPNGSARVAARVRYSLME